MISAAVLESAAGQRSGRPRGMSRQGISERLADCAENPIEAGYQASYERPCWTDRWIFDVFSGEGRYLGEVQMPSGVDVTHLFVDGRLVVALVQNPEGTYMVKRYRLVLPGER